MNTHTSHTPIPTAPQRRCRIITFLVTYDCNAHCVMCDIWKRERRGREGFFDERLIDALVASDNIRENLHTFSLTGGEITIVDAERIARGVGKLCSHLRDFRKLQVNSNAFSARRSVELARALLSHESVPKVAYGLSLHGVGDSHDEVMGTKRAFELWNRTYDALMEIQEEDPRLGVYANCVLLANNVDSVGELLTFADEHDIDIDMSLPIFSNGYLGSSHHFDLFSLSSTQRRRLEEVLEEHARRRIGVRFILERLRAGPRDMGYLGCAFREVGGFVEPKGDFYACGYIKESFVGNLLDDPFDVLWRRSHTVRDPGSELDAFCQDCNANCFPKEGVRENVLKLASGPALGRSW